LRIDSGRTDSRPKPSESIPAPNPPIPPSETPLQIPLIDHLPDQLPPIEYSPHPPPERSRMECSTLDVPHRIPFMTDPTVAMVHDAEMREALLNLLRVKNAIR